MDFIAVLSYEHLDNAMFLNAFSKALARKNSRGIIVHEDSEYTERLIQTGMMREDAQIRAIKDLNHRLVALFADQGISTIGVNGYQKNLIYTDGTVISIDRNQFNNFPEHPMLLISSLISHSGTDKPIHCSLPVLTKILRHQLDIEKTFLFSIDDRSNLLNNDFPKKINTEHLASKELFNHLPRSFHGETGKYILTSADIF